MGFVGEAPAVEELPRGAGRTEELGEQRSVGLVTQQQGDPGVAAVGLVGRAG
jgi:hypothetical protein